MSIYIYQIYDNTNGNSYVGSTNNIYRRIFKKIILLMFNEYIYLSDI
jgi:hypothetical protein